MANNWRTWIPPRVYSLPRHGTLNIHDSLLPKYAGFSPLIWALVNGEQEVGVTAHMMDEVLDAGDIVDQRAVPVEPTDTATDLFHKTVDLIAPVTLGALARIAAGETEFTPQDRSQASFFHKRSEEDIRIDWDWPADALSAWCAPSRPRTRAPSPSTRASAWRFCPRSCPRAATEAPRADLLPRGRRRRHRRRRGRPHRTQPRPRDHPRVRTEDGRELPASAYFTSLGGYLTSRP